MIHHTPRRSLRFQPGAGSQPEGAPRCLAITSLPNTDSLDTVVQDNSTMTTFTLSSSAITSTAVDILPSNTHLPATIDTISSLTYTTAAHDMPLTTITPVLLPDTTPITYMPLVTGITSSDKSPAPSDMSLATGASANMYTRSITTDYSPLCARQPIRAFRRPIITRLQYRLCQRPSLISQPRRALWRFMVMFLQHPPHSIPIRQ